MPFTLESDVDNKTNRTHKNMGKPLSLITKKKYIGKLNTLARLGWDNRDALKKDAARVIANIQERYPGSDEKAKFNRREILYAIFWAMDEDYLKQSNPYYKYVNSNHPSVVQNKDGEDVPWVSPKVFNKN